MATMCKKIFSLYYINGEFEIQSHCCWKHFKHQLSSQTSRIFRYISFLSLKSSSGFLLYLNLQGFELKSLKIGICADFIVFFRLKCFNFRHSFEVKFRLKRLLFFDCVIFLSEMEQLFLILRERIIFFIKNVSDNF